MVKDYVLGIMSKIVLDARQRVTSRLKEGLPDNIRRRQRKKMRGAHVEGDSNGIYGAHDCFAVVQVFALAERVELLNARSHKRVDRALSRNRTPYDEINVPIWKRRTVARLL
jgi:hypothetical protein